MEPLIYHNHVRTTTRSYCLGCNFRIRQDLQSKQYRKNEFSFPPSFTFKEGRLEEISLDFQEVQKVQEAQRVQELQESKPKSRGANTYWKCTKCGPVCRNSKCWELIHRPIIPKGKKRKDR